MPLALLRLPLRLVMTATLAGVSLHGLLAQAPPAPPPAPAPLPAPTPVAPAAPKTSLKKLTLGECLAIAEVNHPALRMAESSLSQTVKGAEAIRNLPKIAEWIKPELPVRRMQAANGITAAEAAVAKAHQEIRYDVCRLYYTVVYARQQEFIVNEITEQLKLYKDFVDKFLAKPEPNSPLKITAATAKQINIFLAKANDKLEMARAGQAKAIAALKQAMGVDPATKDFEPKDTELPIMGGTVTEEQVIQHSMARRPELVQAAAATDAFRLEVCAQDKNRFGLQVQTLSNATDLHANVVPAPVRNGEYRPGATPPEMPPFLFGKRTERVSRAIDISRRQDAQYDQVQSLVKLQAIYAYETWRETNARMKNARIGFDNGRELADLIGKNTGSLQGIDSVQQFGAALIAQSEYLDAVYEHVKALINLELVTAGAVKANFPGR